MKSFGELKFDDYEMSLLLWFESATRNDLIVEIKNFNYEEMSHDMIARLKIIVQKLERSTDKAFDEFYLENLHCEIMPDKTISVEEMKEYGYKWNGMLPLRKEAALALYNSCELFRLYSDDTEGLLLNENDLIEHSLCGGIFGIEKPCWISEVKSRMNKKEDNIRCESILRKNSFKKHEWER